MKKILLMAAAAASFLGAFAPLAHADAVASCRQEISNRGWANHLFDQVRINGGQVTGLLRSGNEVLTFSCMVDNTGNVGEVFVNKSF